MIIALPVIQVAERGAPRNVVGPGLFALLPLMLVFSLSHFFLYVLSFLCLCFGLIEQPFYEIKIGFIISILKLIDKVYDGNYLASTSFERLYTRAWPMTSASQMIITQFKTQLC